MRIRCWLAVVATIILLGSGVYFHEQMKSVYTWESNMNYNFSGELTVVTYNIRFGKGLDGKVNLDRTIASLKDLNADIISLQEVERYSVRSHFFDQVQRLATELEMNVLYFPSLSYPGLYYGNVILSKFPIVETDVIPFMNKGENRAAVIAKILLCDMKEVYVINTHLGLNKEERIQAMHVIKRYLGELNNPIILTGDLNSTPKMNEYEMWGRFLTKSNEGIPLQTFYKKDWQIDYIFHSPHLNVERVTVQKNDVSDHFPVVGVFTFGN
ncbi:endonuclease/exonuclease/phosphatase family protein [Anaerobacillus isosaccharinicus]|uniref:Endonuclease/exonuclease/phosphatase family protein n=1 Tax=Anaerobacillus isosaccharinicus TaxID=1532552 RepID=A0A1S2LIK8_9BACI|nr:endonuclease/exonuclease/phosphatase family protein [Anaerobacillus isosaccharinicus]MBA5586116.1 endonuclease/exonuclease/phosphatase family protein [Anaerobacillus isosaccharinicus]QOY35616.1 endonuclease/exonuclease/phosphatase family protein [Anaerobacillus isosaccharinicus]